jgi:hypothetical protein
VRGRACSARQGGGAGGAMRALRRAAAQLAPAAGARLAAGARQRAAAMPAVAKSVRKRPAHAAAGAHSTQRRTQHGHTHGTRRGAEAAGDGALAEKCRYMHCQLPLSASVSAAPRRMVTSCSMLPCRACSCGGAAAARRAGRAAAARAPPRAAAAPPLRGGAAGGAPAAAQLPAARRPATRRSAPPAGHAAPRADASSPPHAPPPPPRAASRRALLAAAACGAALALPRESLAAEPAAAAAAASTTAAAAAPFAPDAPPQLVLYRDDASRYSIRACRARQRMREKRVHPCVAALTLLLRVCARSAAFCVGAEEQSGRVRAVQGPRGDAVYAGRDRQARAASRRGGMSHARR